MVSKARFELTGPRSPDAFVARCGQKGIRLGRARPVIIRAVAASGAPFDFDSLWERTLEREPKVSRWADLIREVERRQSAASGGETVHVMQP
jgi:hypothetical protein